MNLLLNALDAIHAHDGKGEIHIEALTTDGNVLVRITIESAVGRGTTVSVLLPISREG